MKLMYVACSILLLAGCGQDSPEAAPTAGAAVEAVNEQPAGSPLVENPGNPLAQVNGKAKCNLETLAGNAMDGSIPVVAASNRVSLVGWYADQEAMTTGENLAVFIYSQDQSSQWKAAVPTRTERADVDEALSGTGALVASGFSLDLDFSNLRAGYYGVYLDAGSGACGLGRTFEIK